MGRVVTSIKCNGGGRFVTNILACCVVTSRLQTQTFKASVLVISRLVCSLVASNLLVTLLASLLAS